MSNLAKQQRTVKAAATDAQTRGNSIEAIRALIVEQCAKAGKAKASELSADQQASLVVALDALKPAPSVAETDTFWIASPDAASMRKRYVELLTGAHDTRVRLRFFHDSDKYNHSSFEREGTIDALAPAIIDAQSKGYGTFIFINAIKPGPGNGKEGAATDADVEDTCRTLAADLDEGLQQEWHRQPPIIVHTSKVNDVQKVQALWPLDGGILKSSFKPTQQRIAAYYKGSDSKISNPSRVLRLPGTLHIKNPDNPQRVTLIDNTRGAAHWEYTASPGEVLAGLPELKLKQPSSSAGLPVIEATIRDAVSYLDPNATRGEWRDIIAAVHAAPLEGDDDISIRRRIAHEYSDGTLDRQKRGKPSKYKSPEDVDATFDSLPPKEGGITVGTLFETAKTAGWRGNPFDDGRSAIETFKDVFGRASEDDSTNADDTEQRDRKQILEMMNAQFAVVKYGNDVMVAMLGHKSNDPLEFIGTDSFHKMFANKFYRYQDDGVATKSKVTWSKMWFGWQSRREYLSPGVVFEPGQPLEAKGKLNLWRGFGVEPKQGDWSPMKWHILNMCSGDQAHADYIIKWMANAVQNPGNQGNTAIAFRGPQGAGKGILCRTFGEFFGHHFARVSDSEQLTGRFNLKVRTSCAVFLDECLWAGDKKGEGALKTCITEPYLSVEEKNRPIIAVKNCMHILIASNEDWLVPVGLGDRRFFVLDVPGTFAKDKAYWDALYETDGHSRVKQSIQQAMLYDLLHMDLAGFDVRAVPDTAAKTEQKERRLRGADMCLHEDLQEGTMAGAEWEASGLEVDKEAAYRHYLEFSKSQRDYRPLPKDRWARDIYNALGDCARPGKKRMRGKLYPMMLFAPLAECRAAFQKHMGATVMDWQPEPEFEPRQEPEHEQLDDL